MTVYQCLECRKVYGYDSRLKGKKRLDTPDPKTHARYTDCDVWRCPGCNAIQDTRDIHPSFGIRGNRNLKQLSDLEIRAYLLNDISAKRQLQMGDWDNFISGYDLY